MSLSQLEPIEEVALEVVIEGLLRVCWSAGYSRVRVYKDSIGFVFIEAEYTGPEPRINSWPAIWSIVNDLLPGRKFNGSSHRVQVRGPLPEGDHTAPLSDGA